jgi:glucose/arabinose dehydrogenase
MPSRLGALVLLFALAASPLAQPPGFRVEPVVRGLNLACGMAFAPDGRLFVIERLTGNIRVVQGGVLGGAWATVPVAGTSSEERGLIGIAIDPDFLINRYVYVFHARSVAGVTRNVISRLQEVGGVGTNRTEISPEIPSSTHHVGGPMTFGFDGKLYLVTGDALASANAQSLVNLHGKVLRFNVPDGSVPADNPFPGSHIWSYGHRNMFGVTVHPRNGFLYTTENGQFTRDEVNRIIRGGNYGWPMYEGIEPIPDPTTEDPLLTFSPTPDPANTCFYTGPLYPAAYRDGWFICKYTAGQLDFLDLDPSGTIVLSDTVFYDYPNPIFDVDNAPDGSLWVLLSTSGTRGASGIDRFVYDPAPKPALAITATSNRSVGGSLTLGVTAANGDGAVPWLGFSKFASPVPTPFGDFWVPLDVSLPAIAVTADARGYLGVPVIDNPALRGIVVHTQGAVLSGAVITLTNPHSIELR